MFRHKQLRTFADRIYCGGSFSVLCSFCFARVRSWGRPQRPHAWLRDHVSQTLAANPAEPKRVDVPQRCERQQLSCQFCKSTFAEAWMRREAVVETKSSHACHMSLEQLVLALLWFSSSSSSCDLPINVCFHKANSSARHTINKGSSSLKIRILDAPSWPLSVSKSRLLLLSRGKWCGGAVTLYVRVCAAGVPFAISRFLVHDASVGYGWGAAKP